MPSFVFPGLFLLSVTPVFPRVYSLLSPGYLSLSFHINFSLLCAVPGGVDEIMGLAVLFLDRLSPYQMGAEYPLSLAKLNSAFCGSSIPKNSIN